MVHIASAKEMDNDGMRQLKILIVEDHCLVSDVLCAALPALGIEADSVTSLNEATQKIDSLGRLDMILLDYKLPGIVGFEALRSLLELGAKRVAIFSGTVNLDLVEQAIENGACGFVPKTIRLPALRHALSLMAMGEIYFPAGLKFSRGSNLSPEFNLKQREEKVLRLICEGRQNKEIAFELSIPVSTVAVDVKAICRKLGVKNRTQILIEAQRSGLV